MNKLKPNGPNTINLVEEWAQKLGLSESCNSWTWSDGDGMIKRTGEGRKFYPWASSKDWFFFLVLWWLATEAFGGGKSCDRLFSSSLLPGGPFTLYISFSLILAVHLLVVQVATWVLVPFAAFFNLLWVAATKVILFRGHFFINAVRSSAVGINAEVTTSPGIAPPICSHDWPTVLVFSAWVARGGCLY